MRPSRTITNYVRRLIESKSYKNLVLLRNVISSSCDSYFRGLGAPKVDLYLISKGVSSPIGRGSDSLPVEIRLNRKKIHLVDSAQFGMEPLVINQFDVVYCYLPSFRGEKTDKRHLTQFYHCEAELRGDLKKAIEVASNLVKNITRDIIGNKELNINFRFNRDFLKHTEALLKKDFPEISFDEAVKTLNNNGFSELVKYSRYGRTLRPRGEEIIAEIIGRKQVPVWIRGYDRDVVAFYQKPDPRNKNKVLNADLVFPPFRGGFGGEIIGLGQRQDVASEIVESMERQKILNTDDYRWYIDLRKNDKYQRTAGFGMGIERYISWLLGLKSIKDACIYPVAKDSIGFF